jgi:hypothetical protein
MLHRHQLLQTLKSRRLASDNIDVAIAKYDQGMIPALSWSRFGRALATRTTEKRYGVSTQGAEHEALQRRPSHPEPLTNDRLFVPGDMGQAVPPLLVTPRNVAAHGSFRRRFRHPEAVRNRTRPFTPTSRRRADQSIFIVVVAEMKRSAQ